MSLRWVIAGSVLAAFFFVPVSAAGGGQAGNVSICRAADAAGPCAQTQTVKEPTASHPAHATPAVEAVPPASAAGKHEDLMHFFADLAQIISNFVVMITFAFGLYQWTKNLKHSKNAAAQSSAHALNGFYMALATTPDLAKIYRKGRNSYASLSADEQDRFFFTCVAWFAHHEQAFGQWKDGLLPEEYWASWAHALEEDLTDDGFQKFWSLERLNFDAPFRELIDNAIAKHPKHAGAANASATPAPQPAASQTPPVAPPAPVSPPPPGGAP